MALSESLHWSVGEHRMHELLHVPERDNPTASYLTAQAAFAVSNFPLIVVGVLEADGTPITSIWGGAPGHTRPLGQSMIGISTHVADTDPVRQTLEKQGFRDQMISGLAIDLVKRKRVKLFGRVVAGAVKDDDMQLIIAVQQSLGNCPKYLNQWDVKPIVSGPKIVSDGRTLSDAATKLIQAADLFFMSSTDPGKDMDTNHRGGAPGFVLVQGNDKLVYPEYSGNRLYQSLGNIISNPLVGLCFPDFATGDVLHVAGTARILVGKDAAEQIPHTNLAVEISVKSVRLVGKGLPVSGRLVEYSPYNPKLRSTRTDPTLDSSSDNRARVIAKDEITETITRYRFKTNHPVSYKPGQWLALDLSGELDIGYSHMRDDDPQSLNDDFIRTFTISSHPSELPNDEFEMVLRTNGPVTTWLRGQRAPSNVEVRMLGTGGDFIIDQERDPVVFVAGGVGITPLLGQLSDLDHDLVRLIWIIKAADVKFVLDILDKYPAVAKHATIFVTSGELQSTSASALTSKTGLDLLQRRPSSQDFASLPEAKYYICAGQSLRRELLVWLEGRSVFYENFDY